MKTRFRRPRGGRGLSLIQTYINLRGLSYFHRQRSRPLGGGLGWNVRCRRVTDSLSCRMPACLSLPSCAGASAWEAALSPPCPLPRVWVVSFVLHIACLPSLTVSLLPSGRS